MFKISIHKNVIRFIKTRKPSEQKLISTKIELLKENPYNHKELDIKKMSGMDDIFRLRIGRYRFIYQIKASDSLVLLMIAGYRGNVYK